MYGAWAGAVPLNSGLVQLRALDWDVTGPLQNYPVVLVHHPEPGNGHASASLGWAGW